MSDDSSNCGCKNDIFKGGSNIVNLPYNLNHNIGGDNDPIVKTTSAGGKRHRKKKTVRKRKTKRRTKKRRLCK
jgi:hypothetical protein